MKNVTPISAEARAEVREVQAPDDLVGAAREVAPDVERDGRDAAAGCPTRRGRVPAPASSAPRLAAGRVVPRVGRGAGVGHADGDDHGGHDDSEPGHPEHDRGLARDRGRDAADRRADHEPAHLRRAVQPEQLAVALGRVRVHEVATRGRVVDGGRQPRQGPQRDEGERPDHEQRRHREHRGEARARSPSSRLRDVRSATQPNSGSPSRRAAGHAATTIPSVGRSTPCAVNQIGRIGSSAPKPTQITPSAISMGSIGPQASSQRRARSGTGSSCESWTAIVADAPRHHRRGPARTGPAPARPMIGPMPVLLLSLLFAGLLALLPVWRLHVAGWAPRALGRAWVAVRRGDPVHGPVPGRGPVPLPILIIAFIAPFVARPNASRGCSARAGRAASPGS